MSNVSIASSLQAINKLLAAKTPSSLIVFHYSFIKAAIISALTINIVS